MTVLGPKDQNFTIRQKLRRFEIYICGSVCKAKLLLLNMHDFKLILGMDWLSLHRAMLDQFEKTITLKLPSILEFTWKSKLETNTPLITLENISKVDLVREFPYVFPKYFPSLPPEREIEIEITFVFNTSPISIPRVLFGTY